VKWKPPIAGIVIFTYWQRALVAIPCIMLLQRLYVCLREIARPILQVLESPLEKKAGVNYGPPGTKTLIYFVDDLNMPKVGQLNLQAVMGCCNVLHHILCCIASSSDEFKQSMAIAV
jgi:hypothetical protein